MLESNSGAPAEAMDGAARIALLERELELLRRRDAERTAELAARARRIRLLEEALRILQADRYGTSREKLHVAPGQTELFNEAETIAELNEVLGAEVPLKATPQREDQSGTGAKAGRKAIAAHLPRVAIVHDIPQSERHCACGSQLIEIGSDISEQLAAFVLGKICAGKGAVFTHCSQPGQAYFLRTCCSTWIFGGT